MEWNGGVDYWSGVLGWSTRVPCVLRFIIFLSLVRSFMHAYNAYTMQWIHK